MNTHGEMNLKKLLSNIAPVLHDECYVFNSSNMSLMDAAKLEPILIFKEKEGTALILTKEKAIEHNLKYHYESKMITLNVHSSLDAVGFLAAITQKLAAHSISVNPVSAHYHDHLFVPKDRAQDAMATLQSFTE